ncbi:hypothetical protein LCGC14_0185230 [marine sediment metagenome]|uniref:Uncharacterized protein n=1 Tax=marine sediment metagenome TaxID=412755 RepID=A0A0F9V4T0_9ZZZZ|nr:hypothetical protein [Halomonas sp.]HDZ49283.1 hypothetical protein [Halomonas sp.]HEB05130.1 hypothetical protein [Halomonas sp.]
MPKDNITDFNLCAGLLFTQAFQAFPEDAVLDKNIICETLLDRDLPVIKVDVCGQPDSIEPDHQRALKLVDSTARWLIEEGYFRTRSDNFSPYSVTLTQKGFYILGAEPLSQNENRLGAELVKNVESGMWEGVRKLTSDIFVAGIKLGWQELTKVPGGTG